MIGDPITFRLPTAEAQAENCVIGILAALPPSVAAAIADYASSPRVQLEAHRAREHFGLGGGYAAIMEMAGVEKAAPMVIFAFTTMMSALLKEPLTQDRLKKLAVNAGFGQATAGDLAEDAEPGDSPSGWFGKVMNQSKQAFAGVTDVHEFARLALGATQQLAKVYSTLAGNRRPKGALGDVLLALPEAKGGVDDATDSQLYRLLGSIPDGEEDLLVSAMDLNKLGELGGIEELEPDVATLAAILEHTISQESGGPGNEDLMEALVAYEDIDDADSDYEAGGAGYGTEPMPEVGGRRRRKKKRKYKLVFGKEARKHRKAKRQRRRAAYEQWLVDRPHAAKRIGLTLKVAGVVAGAATGNPKVATATAQVANHIVDNMEDVRAEALAARGGPGADVPPSFDGDDLDDAGDDGYAVGGAEVYADGGDFDDDVDDDLSDYDEADSD